MMMEAPTLRKSRQRSWPAAISGAARSLLVLGILLTASCSALGPDLVGAWKGKLTAPPSLEVEMYFDFEASEAGGTTGTLTIPMLGIESQQLSEVSVDAGKIAFSIPEVPGDARFEGQLDAKSGVMAGTFSQAGRNFAFAVQRGSAEGRDSGTYQPGIEDELIKAVASKLEEGYVDEARGGELAARLRTAREAGAFSGAEGGEASGETFAETVTAWLARESNDLHLRFLYHYEEAAGAEAADADNRPREQTDFGFRSVEVLDGNIGYLDLREFADGSPEARAAAAAAMARLAGVESLILDLGHNQGGSPVMVQYLSSYFFDRPTHLVSTSLRGREEPMERWTLDEVGGARFPDSPLYLLTSTATVSAAESFAFGLRALGRATLVGERTAGGGHFSRYHYLGHGFTLLLPIGRTYDPRTGQGWEASGLEPDVAVSDAEALETAARLARARPRT